MQKVRDQSLLLLRLRVQKTLNRYKIPFNESNWQWNGFKWHSNGSKGTRKKSSSLNGRAIKEKKLFFNLFSQRSKISTAIKLKGGGVGGLGLYGPAIKRRTFFVAASLTDSQEGLSDSKTCRDLNSFASQLKKTNYSIEFKVQIYFMIRSPKPLDIIKL